MSQTSDETRTQDIALIVSRGDYPTFYEATSLATAFGALGKQVHMLLTWGALSRVVKGTLDEFEVDPSEGFDHEDIKLLMAEATKGKLPSQSQLLSDLRDMGLVKIYACSGSTAHLGFSRDKVNEVVDEIVGITAFINDMELAQRIMFL